MCETEFWAKCVQTDDLRYPNLMNGCCRRSCNEIIKTMYYCHTMWNKMIYPNSLKGKVKGVGSYLNMYRLI